MTRLLLEDEKRIYDILRQTGGCTRFHLELHSTLTLKQIINALRRMSRHGYAKTGWPERPGTVWYPTLPSQSQ